LSVVKPKPNQFSTCSVRLLSQSQTVVKPKPKPKPNPDCFRLSTGNTNRLITKTNPKLFRANRSHVLVPRVKGKIIQVFKRRISLFALSVKCRKFWNTGMATVECDPPELSSRNSFLSLFPERLKTSESSNSSENSKLGENTDDERIAQVRL